MTAMQAIRQVHGPVSDRDIEEFALFACDIGAERVFNVCVQALDGDTNAREHAERWTLIRLAVKHHWRLDDEATT